MTYSVMKWCFCLHLVAAHVLRGVVKFVEIDGSVTWVKTKPSLPQGGCPGAPAPADVISTLPGWELKYYYKTTTGEMWGCNRNDHGNKTPKCIVDGSNSRFRKEDSEAGASIGSLEATVVSNKLPLSQTVKYYGTVNCDKGGICKLCGFLECQTNCVDNRNFALVEGVVNEVNSPVMVTRQGTDGEIDKVWSPYI